MLEALIIAVIMTFLTFGALDYWVLMSKHQYAEHLMHRYLDRMALEGRLSSADEALLIQDFGVAGIPVESITCPRESRGDARVLRNPDDIEACRITLKVTARPEPQPLFMGSLIGGATAGEDFRIVVGGDALSERVRP